MWEGLFSSAQAVQGGQCSAEELVRDCLRRIDRMDDKVRAWVWRDADRALQRARLVDATRARGEPIGPLAGVPLALKDNICTSFGTTTCGSRILESFRSPYNAFVVDRLEQAGAILVGKTNLDEFAMGSSTETSVFGATRNPWDVTRVAGGSSGGSAVAVAMRMAAAALGSDTGGSVRQPASFCGVVGLKPTYGRVSRFGLVAFGSSLDQIGTLTGDVRDAALLLGVIAGHDPRDSTSASREVPNYLASLDQPLRGMRLGVSDAHFGPGLDPEVEAAVRSAVETLEKEGATVVPVSLDHLDYVIACYYIIATAEASSNLARFDGVHYGRRADHPKDHRDVSFSSRGEGFGVEVKRRIMLGTYVLSRGYYEAYYLRAQKVRTLLRRDFEKAFENVDVIASPVAPTPAFRIGEKREDPLTMYLSDIYTIAANLAGLCAISVPCGFSSEGLPIGLQLMGPAFGEEKLLAVAHQYQQHTDHHRRKPDLCHLE